VEEEELGRWERRAGSSPQTAETAPVAEARGGQNRKGIEMKQQRQGVRNAGIVWATMILCVVLLAALSTVARGAPASTRSGTQERQTTIFDPFTLRSILVSGASMSVRPENPPGLLNPNPRRPIRIPFRLPVRSPCRPGLDGNTTAG